jgi:hypothetical protein
VHSNRIIIYMRADRLLSALLLLQAHGRLTSRQLARRLEVFERTMHRDKRLANTSALEPAKLRERVAADIDRMMDRRAQSYESIRPFFPTVDFGVSRSNYFAFIC